MGTLITIREFFLTCPVPSVANSRSRIADKLLILVGTKCVPYDSAQQSVLDLRAANYN